MSHARTDRPEGDAALLQLPAGIELPSGIILTFPPHRDCPCINCVAAFAAFDASKLELPPESEPVDGLPW